MKINAAFVNNNFQERYITGSNFENKITILSRSPSNCSEEIVESSSFPRENFIMTRDLYVCQKYERLNNCVVLCRFSATGLLCGAIMSDHWEEIGWDKEDLVQANVNLTWYLNGQVARLQSSINHRSKHRAAKSSSFLVPMHGGIWIMCVSLSGTSCRGFDNVQFIAIDGEKRKEFCLRRQINIIRGSFDRSVQT